MATAAAEVSSQTSQAGPLGGCISHRSAGDSTQLGGLVADGDALGAHLARIRAVGIADHARFRAGLEHVARQPAVFHPGRRREHHEPRLVRRLELYVAVRMLVAGLADDAAEAQDPARVVAAPAV